MAGPLDLNRNVSLPVPKLPLPDFLLPADGPILAEKGKKLSDYFVFRIYGKVHVNHFLIVFFLYSQDIC